MVPTAVGAVTQLLRSLRRAGTEEGLSEVELELTETLKEACPFFLKWHEANGSEGFDVEDFKATFSEQSKAAGARALETLGAALEALNKCKGLKKLNECSEALTISERFRFQKRPEVLPETAPDMFKFLGVDKKAGTAGSFALSGNLRPAWEAHRAAWVAEIHGKFTQHDTYKYWKELSGETGSRDLAELALRHLLRPASAAACERIFSFLTSMDAPNRRSMGRPLLTNLLKLRGNADIVRELTAEAAHAKRDAVVSARAANTKRNHEERVAVASNVVQTATKRVRPSTTATAASSLDELDEAL